LKRGPEGESNGPIDWAWRASGLLPLAGGTGARAAPRRRRPPCDALQGKRLARSRRANSRCLIRFRERSLHSRWRRMYFQSTAELKSKLAGLPQRHECQRTCSDKKRGASVPRFSPFKPLRQPLPRSHDARGHKHELIAIRVQGRDRVQPGPWPKICSLIVWCFLV
jgi:hypothetical protein